MKNTNSTKRKTSNFKTGLALSLSLALGLGYLAALGGAHIRLHTGDTTQNLSWSGANNLSIVVNSTGSDNVMDNSHFTALQSAMDAWSGLSGSNLNLVNNENVVQQARTDWQADNVRLVFFDEDNSSGFFPPGSSTVAITPVEFNVGNGNIIDADILFNGSQFLFATDTAPNRYDIQDVATHEFGHLVGLDHSAWGGATMFPFVAQGLIAQRSLASDDQHGARDIYPSGGQGRLTGVVRRDSNNSTVSRAHVTARDTTTGRSVGAALADANGSFDLRGLDAGTYTLLAHPFNGSVSLSNLQPGYTADFDFDATLGGDFTITAGQALNTGNLIVDDPAGSVTLGSAGSALPFSVERGGISQVLLLSGSGLTAGSTLTVSDPDVAVSNVSFGGGTVSFRLNVPSNEELGHFDIQVSNALGSAIIPAAIELVPATPTVTSLTPTQVSPEGGNLITLTGTNFRPGARVVLGSNIYRDGDAIGATVVNDTTITLTTLPTASGMVDAVVLDESGVEGRSIDALEFLAVPKVNSLFPVAGALGGGTELTILGQDFGLGVTVQINGIDQPTLTRASSTELNVVTEAGSSSGAVTLRIINPDMEFVDTVFSYVNAADPQVMSLSPNKGAIAGGTEVTITGDNFSAGMQVNFGADPETGIGGTMAAMVTFVDAQTLTAITPAAAAAGSVSVLVSNTITQQGDVLSNGFQFKNASSGGGGGGGCYTEIVNGPGGLSRGLLNGAWFLLALGFGWMRLQQTRRRAALQRA